MRLPVVLVGAAAMLGAAPLHAIPAFARQTGFPCAQCHTQHFPTLNEFGRNFKLNGYTLVGGATPLVQGSRLSLPAGLNAALFTKVRYQKTSGTDAAGARSTNSGEIQFPDEFALFLAGRISPNIGFFLEGQLPEGDVPLLAGFKMPFSYTVGPVRASVIPFTTDGLGPAYGFELLSTGAVDNIRFHGALPGVLRPAVHRHGHRGVGRGLRGGQREVLHQRDDLVAGPPGDVGGAGEPAAALGVPACRGHAPCGPVEPRDGRAAVAGQLPGG